MQTSVKQSPRELEDRINKRGSAHYHEYNDVYQNTQRSPTRQINPTMDNQGGSYQQRQIPGQSRPPVAKDAFARGPPVETSRPPSYPGLSEKPFDSKDANNQRPQQRRRGYRRTEEDEQPQAGIANRRPERGSVSGPAPISQNQSVPVTRDRQQQSPRSSASRSAEKVALPGNEISRIASPSIMSSVLQPLNKKVEEYNAQMSEEQRIMAQLDAEMASLQEKRRDAEKRFMAAKTKHDDYRRQFQGVERAMRGEPEVFQRLSLDDDDRDDRINQQITRAPPTSSGVSRTDSWDNYQKPKNTSRSRLSKLFGAT